MKKIAIAYFGTPDFSAYFLEKLLKEKNLPVHVKIVVTQADKPAGRKQILMQSAVKALVNSSFVRSHSRPSTSLGAPLIFDESLTKSELTRSLSKVDLALLFAFGQIIQKELLSLPKFGFWNVHPSLLPKYRGPSPVAFALINSERQTGVTIIKMDEEVDHGPIIAQEKMRIFEKEKRPELTLRLTEVAFTLFKNVILKQVRNDRLRQQDHSKATYTKQLTKSDGYVEISKLKSQNSKLTREIFNKFRGLYPWPGLWTEVRIKGEKRRIKITDVDFEDGKLIIKKVQLEGKKEVDFKQFNQAYRIF